VTIPTGYLGTVWRVDSTSEDTARDREKLETVLAASPVHRAYVERAVDEPYWLLGYFVEAVDLRTGLEEALRIANSAAEAIRGSVGGLKPEWTGIPEMTPDPTRPDTWPSIPTPKWLWARRSPNSPLWSKKRSKARKK